MPTFFFQQRRDEQIETLSVFETASRMDFMQSKDQFTSMIKKKKKKRLDTTKRYPHPR